MTTPKTTLWAIEPHTKAKHDILRRYLNAWFPILGKYNQEVTYIDGFCGPGEYLGGEEGSPIIALNAAQNNCQFLNNTSVKFFFFDERSDRIEYLTQVLSPRMLPNNFQYFTKTDSFANAFEKFLNGLTPTNPKPIFAFIDPFGFEGIPFSLVQRLLSQIKTEVFINLMGESINRFLTHPDDKITRHIVTLFGTEKVLDISKQPGDRLTNLRTLYQSQLQQHARFVRFFEMRGKKTQPLYHLFFAGNHPLGHAKMKEAFWKVDPQSGYLFSDSTNPNQPLLFDPQQEVHNQLLPLLQKEFLNQTVPVNKIKQFVEDKTSYCETHMKTALRKWEEQGSIRVEPLKTDGNKRKKGTFPDGVIVYFSA